MPETLNVICLLNWELVRAPLNNFDIYNLYLEIRVSMTDWWLRYV